MIGGFAVPKISLRLQYGPSGCAIGLLVAVGNSPSPGPEGAGWGVARAWRIGFRDACVPIILCSSNPSRPITQSTPITGHLKGHIGILSQKWKIKRKMKWKLGVYRGCLWLAGNEGMQKILETTIMGYMGTTIRIHSFIPS